MVQVTSRPSGMQDLEVVQVLREDGSLDPQLDPGLSADELRLLYRWMVTTRLLDERLVALQRQGRIGFHVGSLGEEAAILGSTFAMQERDWILPCYREFGGALMRGLPLQRYIDNMFGNKNDVVRGRQMPDHYTLKEKRWGSISSPVGTQITQAVGIAWAAKLQKDPAAVLVYFGDGATSAGEFHAGLNFAGVFRAPALFFCRNNGWAISVPTERQTATQTFAEKARAYGLTGVRVDGNDIFAVVAVTRQARARALAGEGATLIEALTYRMGGHSTSDDPNRYRTATDMEPWQKLDPIERLRDYLLKHGHWSDARESELQRDVDADFREAVQKAESTEPPELSTMFDDVYARPPWHLLEQRGELLNGPRAPARH